MPSMDQQSFISGVEHSEVDEVLCGFHDDSHLLPFDTIFHNETDSLMFSATPANGDQQSFFCGAEHSEVDEALFGFLDAHFLPFDTIFQNDTDSLMFSASPANGDQQSFSCGVEHSEVDEALFGFHDDSYPLPFDTIFQNDKDSLMFSAPPANGEGLNNFCLPSPERIHEQPPPVYEQSSFFYPLDPAMAVAAAAGGGGCMSAQSVAARQRRKRISEKTQELGRLIPGGMGMNTAQMLQAAFKYVKFLQAQFGLMASFPECKIAKEEDLQVLVASPAIQEKLAAEGMCVVPTEMLDGLATGIEFKSEPLISCAKDPFISEPLISSPMAPFI